MSRLMNLHTDEARYEAERFSSDLLQVLRGLRPVEPEWRAAGLSIVQVRACDDLRLGPLPVSRLASHVGVGLPDMLEATRRLEQLGIVERVPTPADLRLGMVKLTTYGQQVAEEWHASRVHRAGAALADLTPTERHLVLDVLDRMAIGVARMDATMPGPLVQVETYHPEPEVLAESAQSKPPRSPRSKPSSSTTPSRTIRPAGTAQWAWSR